MKFHEMFKGYSFFNKKDLEGCEYKSMCFAENSINGCEGIQVNWANEDGSDSGSCYTLSDESLAADGWILYKDGIEIKS